MFNEKENLIPSRQEVAGDATLVIPVGTTMQSKLSLLKKKIDSNSTNRVGVASVKRQSSTYASVNNMPPSKIP